MGGPRLTGTTLVTDLPPGVPPPPPMHAGSYLLADLATGQVLAAKGPHVRDLPASTLKTLTALTLLPDLPPTKVYRAVPEDIVDGSKVGMSPGSTYTAQQMLQGLMLSSGNDAAMGLARVAGGVPQTVARMQATAHSLGAFDTVVKNPSGLDAPGQVTSAYDLALIARSALEQPALRALVTTKRAYFPGRSVRAGKVRKTYEIGNHNRLLYNYRGTIGVKNGYTLAARWTVVAAATRGDRSYLVTALRRKDSSWRPTAALLDWAFSYGAQARSIGRLVEPGEVTASPTPTPPTTSAEPISTAPPISSADAGAPSAPQPTAASSSPQTPVSAMRTLVGRIAMVAAGLAVLLLVLSASARRRQLRVARAARSRSLRRH